MTKPSAASVSDVLKYYDTELVPVLAAAIVVDDKFPIEVLNEVRAAMTHLARADKLSSTSQKYDLEASMRHLQRGVLDAAKTGIAGLARRCDKAISILEQDYLLPPEIFSEITAIRQERVGLSVSEAQDAPTHELVIGYLELFSKFDRYYTDIDTKYALGDDKKRVWTRRWKKKAIAGGALLISFVLGLFTEYLGSQWF